MSNKELRITIILTLVNGSVHFLVHEAFHPPGLILALAGLGVEFLIVQFHFLLGIRHAQKLRSVAVDLKFTALKSTLDELVSGLHRSELASKLRIIDSHKEIPGVTESRLRVESEIDALAAGDVKTYSRWDMHDVDIECLKGLRAGDRSIRGGTFFATVPTPLSWDEQVSDKNFLSYIDAQKEARRDGIKVQRLYFLTKNEVDSDVVKNHLNELVHAGLEVRWLSKERSDQQDFLLFGKWRCSEARIDRSEWDNVLGNFTSDAREIGRLQRAANILWKEATPYSSKSSLEAGQFLRRQIQHIEELSRTECYRSAVRSWPRDSQPVSDFGDYVKAIMRASTRGVAIESLVCSEMMSWYSPYESELSRFKVVTKPISSEETTTLIIFGEKWIWRVVDALSENKELFSVECSTDGETIGQALRDWSGASYWGAYTHGRD